MLDLILEVLDSIFGTDMSDKGTKKSTNNQAYDSGKDIHGNDSNRDIQGNSTKNDAHGNRTDHDQYGNKKW